MESTRKPRQGGGLMQAWQSPDGEFHRLLLKLDLDCQPDPYPGVVSICDPSHAHVFVAEVKNLQRELPALLKKIEGTPIACFDLELDDQKRTKIMAGLSSRPQFVG